MSLARCEHGYVDSDRLCPDCHPSTMRQYVPGELIARAVRWCQANPS